MASHRSRWTPLARGTKATRGTKPGRVTTSGWVAPISRNRGPVALAAVVSVVASILVVLALRTDGYESRHVDLNDGGIWVTSNADGLFGRLNKPAGSLDLALNPPGGVQSGYTLDVRQDGAAVVAWDQGSGKLLPVDVAAGKAADDQAVPVSSDEDVAIAGGTLAVLDPGSSKVWAQQVSTTSSVTSLAGVEPTSKPVVTLGAKSGARDAALAVGGNGTVYTADSSGQVAVAAQSGVKFAKAATSQLGSKLESVQITVVGSSVVVLDAKQGVVYLPGGRRTMITPDADARLQRPSPGGSDVIIATRSDLLSVPLVGGKATTLFRGVAGRPTEPTWLGDCVHAAWGGEPGRYVRSCGGDAAKQIPLPDDTVLEQPVFRVNRGAILLNDLALGNVFDLDSLQEVDNWSQVKPPPKARDTKKNNKNNTTESTRDLPPKAVDDRWGARPGRTTVVHVLDNDSDPNGAILAITRVTAVSDRNAQVTVSPDGQAVQVTLPSTGARSLQFKYTIDDGKGLSAQANVDIQVRSPDQNEPPRLRYGFAQRAFQVSAGGSLNLPVVDDWRDFDGDPLVVSTARVGGGSVTVAPSGRLNYVAAATDSSQTITYGISDGQSAPISQRIPVTVLGPSSTRTAAPVAEPDIARGQVGKPIVVDPLANDLPGADPTNPDAKLGIAGTIASPAGVKVDTDLKSGTVTVTASRQGSYRLTYTASYGNAKFSQAPIRIDAVPPPASAQPPVAVPDTGVIYGQTAATVDVLANDFDPAGGVLVVQRAVALDPQQLQVSIIEGRFVRVLAQTPKISPNPQVVRYTITNGLTAPVTGELTLTQVPEPADDTPLAVDDYATVRSGDSTLVPVLDNDIDPAGAALSLLDDVPDAPSPGGLTVTAADGTRRAIGAAFVSGKQVRYAAPVVRVQTSVTVAYVARNPAGNRAAGIIHVTIVPPPSAQNPNQAPAAQPVNSRVISGQTLRISIPTTGVDPDGDTANVTGITSAPTLGRIVSIGATSITYEAFPTASGTDRFGYLLSDRYGKTSRSTVSVGVGQVSDPQPPAAVDDVVTAAPNSKVRVDVLANDVIAPGDAVSIGDLKRSNPETATPLKLVARGGPIQVTAPPKDGQSTAVQYSVSDGSGDPSIGTITIRSQQGYVPPPTVVDLPATPKPGQSSVTVDVLAKATDPQLLPLRVTKVFDPQATVAGSKVTIPLLATVQNVVYQVSNTQGGVAAAVIHVPARGAGAPYAKPDTLIQIDKNGSRTIDIADYVVDPRGRPVRLTTASTLATAPVSDLQLTSPDTTHLKITGRNNYIGPAAITFEVTDGKTLNDPDGRLALITVQVQVGPDTPVIRCPSAPIHVIEGGPDRSLDIASLCHVWVADRARLGQVDYSASWTQRPADVDILVSGSPVIGLRANGGARPGSQGRLTITATGTQARSSTLNVVVDKLGPPSISAIRVDGFKAGSTMTRDISGSVSSPMRDPKISVISITQLSGEKSTHTASGARVNITPGADSHGIMTFAITVTDVADRSRTDRQVTGRLTLEVLNVPDAPGAPQAGRTVLSQTVVLSWPTPASNGAQIDRYQVQWPGGSQTCPASPCRIVNLTNGTAYAFTVRAHNAVGFGKPSPALSPRVTPNKLPAAVTQLRTSDPQDGAITVSWVPVGNGGTAPTSFRVSWSGGGAATVGGGSRSVVARGLDNHNVYTFTVVAVNTLGPGPGTNTQGQSAGKPSTPANVQATYADAAGTTQRAVVVTWTASDPNGAGPATYTVTRNGSVICKDVEATSCNDSPASAKTYTYSVVARNVANKVSGAGTSTIVVAGTPDQPTITDLRYTAKDGELQLTYTAPDSHGQQPRIQCTSSAGSCGTWTPPAAGQSDTRLLGGLPNDSDITVTITSCNEQQCGPASAGRTAHTSGPPAAPSVSCSRSGNTITWNWNRPAAINNNTVDRFSLGGESGGTTAATSFSSTVAADGSAHRLTVTSIDSRGESGGTGADTCNAAPPPPPPDPLTFKVRMGSHTTGAGCSSGCSFFAITYSGAPSGQSWHVYFVADDGFSRDYSFNTGNGSGSPQFTGYWGGPSSRGNGTVTGRLVNAGGTTVKTDTCTGDWKNTGGC